MIKLLLTLIMMFTFGTSTVNAEENTTSIEDRISELAKIKSGNQSIIEAKVDELSEDELKAVIANVNKLKEQTEDDLTIKEAAINKLEEVKGVETLNPLAIWIGVLGFILIYSSWFMVLTGYSDEVTVPLIAGVLMVVLVLFHLLLEC